MGRDPPDGVSATLVCKFLLKSPAGAVDNPGMAQDLLNLGLPVAIMAALIVVLWIAGLWTLVKDESGPAVLFTRLMLVGFVVFLAWRFAVPLFV